MAGTARRRKRSPVAQLAEHPAVNRRVAGSSPARGVGLPHRAGLGVNGGSDDGPLRRPGSPRDCVATGDPSGGTLAAWIFPRSSTREVATLRSPTRPSAGGGAISSSYRCSAIWSSRGRMRTGATCTTTSPACPADHVRQARDGSLGSPTRARPARDEDGRHPGSPRRRGSRARDLGRHGRRRANVRGLRRHLSGAHGGAGPREHTGPRRQG